MRHLLLKMAVEAGMMGVAIGWLTACVSDEQDGILENRSGQMHVKAGCYWQHVQSISSKRWYPCIVPA